MLWCWVNGSSDEGTTVLPNLRKYTTNTTASHASRLEPSATLLPQSQISDGDETLESVQGRTFLDKLSNCQKNEWGDTANLAHYVGQDGARWTNESTNYCHQIIVEHKAFSTKGPAWVAVEYGDDHRHVSTCEHSAANCHHTNDHNIQHINIKQIKSYIPIQFLHVSAPRHHLQGIQSTKVCKYSHSDLGIAWIKC